MPQIFQVLRCYKCLVFQVHQTKKSNKWQCKMCGEKQSVKRHYGIGTGKECRVHVQKLNKIRGDKEESNENVEDSDQDSISNDELYKEYSPTKKSTQFRVAENSKWSIFFDENEEKLDPTYDLKLDGQIMEANTYQSKYNNRSKQFNKKRKISTSMQNVGNLEEKLENKLLTPCNYNALNTINKKENFIINSVNNYVGHSPNINEYKNKMDNGLLNANDYSPEHINSHLVNKNTKAINMDRALSKTVESSKYFTPTKSFTAKNSKWSHYIDEIEESEYISKDVCIDIQNVSVEMSQDKDDIKDITKQQRAAKEFERNETKQIENVELECLEEKLKGTIYKDRGDTSTDLNLKLVEHSDSQSYEDNIFCKESRKTNLFSLCDDTDLDSVLNI